MGPHLIKNFIPLFPYEKYLDCKFTIQAKVTAREVIFTLNNWENPLELKNSPLQLKWKDELWKSTCFEMFYKKENSPEYGEFNFSPDGHYAHYQFSSYREGMKSCPTENNRECTITQHPNKIEYCFKIHVPAADLFSFTAVIKSEQQLQYWSAWEGHGQLEKPDFHHEGNFCLKNSF